MRGDRPQAVAEAIRAVEFTPHARGSTEEKRQKKGRGIVYPACAGIDPDPGVLVLTAMRLPRMRGDRPLLLWPASSAPGFTPHARGSTPPTVAPHPGHCVYPACAGIDLGSDDRNLLQLSLPRMRGDRPYYSYCEHCDALFTPHARGSTRQKP